MSALTWSDLTTTIVAGAAERHVGLNVVQHLDARDLPNEAIERKDKIVECVERNLVAKLAL